jgi:hypothetical protein
MSVVGWVNNIQGFVTAILTLVYVIATIAILAVMTRANALSQRNIELLQDIEKSRLRPYVTFDIEVERGIASGLLKNHGLSGARDVRINLEPKVTELVNNRPQESALTRVPIGSLAPGRELREVIDASGGFLGQYQSPIFRGDIHYRGATGTEYIDPLVVDLTVHQHLMWTDLPDYVIEAPKLEKAIRDAVQAASRPARDS